MSLRDQLLAKGLVSKKQASKVNRELKKKRKQKQSKRDKRRDVEALESKQQAEARDAKQAERVEARQQREAARDVHEQRVRALQIVEGNQIRHQGRTHFHFKRVCGRRIGRLEVSEKVAWMLRCGEAAIAVPDVDTESYVVITGKAASKLKSVSPQNVVFFTENTKGISEPDEAFLVRRWDMSLKPHRKK